MRLSPLLAALLALPVAALPVAALADSTTTFRLLPDPANMTACIGLEPSFERPFTLTVAGTAGTLTSAGGVSIAMSPTAPDKYHGIFELAGERLDYTADLGATKVLSVRGNNLGCKFSGKAD